MAAAPPAHVDETMEEAVVSDDVKVAAAELDGNGNGNGHAVVALADGQEQPPADDSTGIFFSFSKIAQGFSFETCGLGNRRHISSHDFYLSCKILEPLMRKCSRICWNAFPRIYYTVVQRGSLHHFKVVHGSK